MILKFEVCIIGPYLGRITREGVSPKLGSTPVSYSDCATFRLKNKIKFRFFLVVTNNQYVFLVVIGIQVTHAFKLVKH